MRALHLIGLIGCAVVVGTGCATQRRHDQGAFVFTAGTSGCWRASHLDFVAIAKKFATENNVQFNFEDSKPYLIVLAEREGPVVCITFEGRPGSEIYRVEIDPSGKVVRNHGVCQSNY